MNAIRPSTLAISNRALLSALLLAAAPAALSQGVTIADPELEKAIRAQLYKPEGELTPEDMQSLTWLDDRDCELRLRELQRTDEHHHPGQRYQHEPPLDHQLQPTDLDPG